MRTQGVLVWLLFALAGVSPAGAAEATVPASPYEAGLSRKLSAPESAGDRTYLGLGDSTGTFTFSQIKARVVIVELFSMYCRYCQESAAKVNKVYSLIQENGYGDRIKVLGIGVENTPLEAKIFKKKYDVPFPILSDRNGGAKANFYYTETPYFVAINLDGGSPPAVFFVFPGEFDDPSSFYDSVLKKSGLVDLKE